MLVQHAEIGQLLRLAAPRPLPNAFRFRPALGKMRVVEQSALTREPFQLLHQHRRAGRPSLRDRRRPQKALSVPAVIEKLRLPQAFVHACDLDLVVFGNIRRADAEGRTDPRVLIRLHHRVNVRKVGHLIDRRHAEAQAFQAAEKDAPIPLLR